MNFKTILVLIAMFVTAYGISQNAVFSQDFETLVDGKGLKSKEMGAFTFWGKAKWKVTSDETNNYARSNGIQGVALSKVIKLEANHAYKWKFKIRPNGAKNTKGAIVFSVFSGPKEDRHLYLKKSIKNITMNNWSTQEFDFKVIPGREKVTLSIYRWAEGIEVDVDDFELIKQ